MQVKKNEARLFSAAVIPVRRTGQKLSSDQLELNVVDDTDSLQQKERVVTQAEARGAALRAHAAAQMESKIEFGQALDVSTYAGAHCAFAWLQCSFFNDVIS